jgi:DNA-binding CsgD family transcriptional regulator/PAS domain-containing protein
MALEMIDRAAVPAIAHLDHDTIRMADGIAPVAIQRPIQIAALDSEYYAPLANVAREIGRELQGDGMLIGWHASGGDPMYLFADVAQGLGARVEREMASMAALAGTMQTFDAHSEWRQIGNAACDGLLTTTIPADGGVVTVTTVFRRIGQSTRKRASEASARLLPLVQPFFRIWASRLRSATRLRALTAAIDRSDVGVLLVDASGRLTFANEAAEALIARNDGLRRLGGMLAASHLADTLNLQTSVQHVLASGADDPKGSATAAPVVALRRSCGRPLMATIVPVRTLAQPSGDAAAIVYVFDPGRTMGVLLEPVCKFFGLSRVETQLACLIGDGMVLSDAAKAMHVRELTARSYLKQVFLKTGTKRQAELVGLLLKSAVRTHRIDAKAPATPN